MVCTYIVEALLYLSVSIIASMMEASLTSPVSNINVNQVSNNSLYRCCVQRERDRQRKGGGGKRKRVTQILFVINVSLPAEVM